MGYASSAVMAFLYTTLAILFVSLCLLTISVSYVSSSISFRFSVPRIARRPSRFCTQCNSNTKQNHTSHRLLEGLSTRNPRCSTIHTPPQRIVHHFVLGRRNPYIAPRGWSRMYNALVAARQGEVRPEPFTTRGVLMIEAARGELL